MSESYLEDGNARMPEQQDANGDVREPEVQEPSDGAPGSDEPLAGSVNGPGQDPPFPPRCRAEFTVPAASEQDEFVDEADVSAPRLSGRGVVGTAPRWATPQ